MPSSQVRAQHLSHPESYASELQAVPISNGLQNPGTVTDSNGDISNTPGNHGTNGLASDSILEGKQVVKAASAVCRTSTGTISNHQSPNGTSRNTTARKRSHSGSIIHSLSSEEIPVRLRETPGDRILLEQYVFREFKHSALAATKNPNQEILQQKVVERDYYINLRRDNQMNPAAIYGVGYEGFGNARTDIRNQHPQLLYPSSRPRPGGRKSRELRVSRRDMKAQSEQFEDLVPIRLDIEWDKVKIRDTFTWNLHDHVTSPDLFAEKLVEDLGLPLESYVPLVRQISQSIQEQVSDYYPHVFIEDDALDPHLPYSAYKNDEMRILIKLNITIGQHTLVDQFEWEINNPYNSPEEFAQQMTADLSLSGEFTTAIAHSIREQEQLFIRSLYITSHPFDGRPIEDPDLKAAFLPTPLPSPFRPFQAAKEFTPYLYELNDVELERTEVSISREQRRQKRSVNRRGGPALPDLKDRQRTIRTMIVSSVLPNSAPSIDDTHLFKRSGTGRGRRAAAGQRDGGDESDLSDSEDSSMGSPAIGIHLAHGTARTRGMRGATSVAQAALRANLAHSATPEPSSHHHDTRPSRRRDYREDSSDEPEKLVVKLKLPRERFLQFLRDLKTGQKPPGTPILPGPTQTSQPGTPKVPTPVQSSMPPPQAQVTPAGSTTPGTGSKPLLQPVQAPVQQIGAVDAPHPPQPGVPGVG